MPRMPKKLDLKRELEKALRKQRKDFIKRYGREPGPDDPLFPDMDAPGDVARPTALKAMMDEVTQAMVAANSDPAWVYAFRKTGLMPPAKGYEHNWPPENLREWGEAVREYHRLEAEGRKA